MIIALALMQNSTRIRNMSKFIMLLVLAAALIVASGCSSPSGSREYIPGKGWVPN